MQTFQFHKDLNNPIDLRTVEKVVSAMKSDVMKNLIEPIRKAKQNGDDELAARLKKKLPAFTASAHFSNRRKRENFLRYIGCIVLDIDHLPLEMVAVIKEAACKDPHVLIAAISPSGDGLKIFIMVDSKVEQHKIAFDQVCNYFSSKLCVPFDEKVSDITRLTFMTFDPEVYFNPNATVFHIEKPVCSQTSPDLKTNNEGPTEYEKKYEFAHKCISKKMIYQKGNRNNFVYRLACFCNRLGIPMEALPWMINWCDLPASEIQSVLKSAYSNDKDFNTFEWKQDNARVINLPQTVFKTATSNLGQSNQLQIPQDLKQRLPRLLSALSLIEKGQEQSDIGLTAGIAHLSALITNVKGVYKSKLLYPNMHTMIVAPPAGGKGTICRVQRLFEPLHNKMVKEASPMHGLFLSDNTTTSALIRKMSDNEGQGILVSNDVNFLGYMIKRDPKGLAGILNATQDSERVTNGRSSKRATVVVREPKMACCFAVTPNQVDSIFPNANDSVVSRFLYYTCAESQTWIDVVVTSLSDFEATQDKFSRSIIAFNEYLIGRSIEFRLKEEQTIAINDLFSSMLQQHSGGSGAVTAVIKRLGEAVFKLSMTFATLRAWEIKSTDEVIYCSDDDFNAAMQLAQVYFKHAALMVKYAIKETVAMSDQRLQTFFEALPVAFDRKTAIAKASELGLNLSDRSIDGMLKELCEICMLNKQYNDYRKANRDEMKSAA